MKKILKVGLGGDLLACLAAAAEREQVAEGELVRRALWLYFGALEQAPQPGSGQALGPADSGPDEAQSGPDSGPRPAAGGGSPPFSPLHSSHPPSVSPPLPPEKQVAASPGEPSAADLPPAPPPPPEKPAGVGGPGAAALPLFPLSHPELPAGADPAGTGAAVLQFPCIRHPRSGEMEWALSPRQLERWEEIFPAMDVLGELRKAREYLTLRSERRKTARGMPKFLFAWLARGQDNGRYLRRSSPAASGSAAGSAGAAASPEPTLFDEYGFESWEQWEATLRDTLTGATLDDALTSLGKLRRRWDEGRRRA